MTSDEIQQKFDELDSAIADLKRIANKSKESSGTIDQRSFSNLEVFTKPIRVVAGNAATAGGRIAMFIGTGNFGIYFGSGAPTVSAAKGSLYLRSEGSSTSTRAYINTDGGTTWTAITTAA